MKDQLLQLATKAPPEARRNLAREYLQCTLLRTLQERSDQRDLAFCGGTALRLLHDLARFSEDLDFVGLAETTPESAEAIFIAIKAGCLSAGYDLKVKLRKPSSVASAMFRFEGLPAELGLTADARLALSVKMEIDCRPPAGAEVETTLIHRFFPIAIRHHDLPSLFAGKLHALLARPWSKGRDWYDLVWYLTAQRGLVPNRKLLSAALEQTGHDVGMADRWAEALIARLAELDFQQIESDIAPFLERPEDLGQIDRLQIEALLAKRGARNNQ